MMTNTASTPITPKMTSETTSGLPRKLPIALGIRPTMPAKMMKLMPFPMPFSVISSPSHMRRTDPAVRVMIWVRVSKREMSKGVVRIVPCEANSARNPYDWSIAMGTAR